MTVPNGIQFQRDGFGQILVKGNCGSVTFQTLLPYMDRIMLCVDAHDELVEALQEYVRLTSGEPEGTMSGLGEQHSRLTWLLTVIDHREKVRKMLSKLEDIS